MQDLLRQARNDALSEAPPMGRGVDDVVAEGRRRHGRHRLLQGGAAVATAAAVVAAIALPHSFAARPGNVVAAPPAAAAVTYPTSDWMYGFKGYRTGDFTVTGAEHVTPGYQELYVQRGKQMSDLYDGVGGGVVASSPLYSANITVYRPGVFQPTKFANGEKVTVNGRPGLFASSMMYIDSSDIGPNVALAWQYADNAWAVAASVVDGEFNRAELLQLAAGLAPSPPAPVTVAFKTDYTPQGYSLTSAGRTDDFPSGASYMSASIRLSKTRPSYTSLTEPVDASLDHGPTVRIALYPVEFTDTAHRQPGGAAYCNAGNANLCFRMSPDGRYLAEIYADGGAAIPQSELLRTLRGVEFANPAQPSTWFALTSAIPASAL
ncbi:hypothetical protein [Dactylosporangium matsuzakiense]|nr:hypothetical protein [Dactylosporangium matsuzakiense]UWZ45354.1 hypothetical protein Dmats_02005 [Dactylosporangium matsuzakiense]